MQRTFGKYFILLGFCAAANFLCSWDRANTRIVEVDGWLSEFINLWRQPILFRLEITKSKQKPPMPHALLSQSTVQAATFGYRCKLPVNAINPPTRVNFTLLHLLLIDRIRNNPISRSHGASEAILDFYDSKKWTTEWESAIRRSQLVHNKRRKCLTGLRKVMTPATTAIYWLTFNTFSPIFYDCH